MKKNGILYLAVELNSPPGTKEDVMFDVLIDSDFDTNVDGAAAFLFSNSVCPWFYDHSLKGTKEVARRQSASQELIEMAIPLDAVGSDKCQVLPIIRNIKEGVNYDEWNVEYLDPDTLGTVELFTAGFH